MITFGVSVVCRRNPIVGRRSSAQMKVMCESESGERRASLDYGFMCFPPKPTSAEKAEEHWRAFKIFGRENQSTHVTIRCIWISIHSRRYQKLRSKRHKSEHGAFGRADAARDFGGQRWAPRNPCPLPITLSDLHARTHLLIFRLT